MKVLAGGLRSSLAVKSAQSSLQNFNKAMTLGTDYRLFMRPIWYGEGEAPDLLAASVLGRRLDGKKLDKKYFVVINDYEQEESGKTIDMTGLQNYASIARVMHQAECATEQEHAKREATEEARKLGREVDPVSLSLKLKEIHDTYFGDPDAKPQRIYATVDPMIGGKTIIMATEVGVLPLLPNGEPDWGKFTVTTFELSGKRAKKILEVMADAKYLAPGSEFVEFGWSWKGKDNNEAGAAATFQGISNDTSIKTLFPALWETNKSKLDSIAKTPEVIAAHNRTMSSTITPEEVVESFKKYLIKNPLILTNIDFQAADTKRVAKDIIDFGIVDDVKPVQEQLLALINSEDEAAEESTAETSIADALSAEQSKQLAEAGSVGDIAAAVGDLDAITAGDGIDDL